MLHIKYGSTVIDVPLDTEDITTVAHVKAFLEKHHANLDPDSIKLIAAGKVLDNSTPLSLALLRGPTPAGKQKPQPHLTLMASNKQQLAAFSAAAELPRHQRVRVRNDLHWDDGHGGGACPVCVHVCAYVCCTRCEA